MADFRSNWIDRNIVYRRLPDTGETPHFRREERRVIVCLCGSTRFSEAFREANLRETLAGKIVLSVGCDTKSDQGLGLTDADKATLDLLHLDKIDLADEVLVLNLGGYVGDSTRREVLHALARRKVIRWLEPDRIPADLANAK